MNKLICPVCKQDWVIRAKLKPINELVLVCPECFSTWTLETSVTFKNHQGLKQVMVSKGITPTWSEVEPQEE